MRLLYRLLALVLITYCYTPARAQTRPSMDSYVKAIDSTRQRLPAERLFLHLDKPNYTAGDTIWFKAYLLNADLLTSAERSGILYVEVNDIADKCVKRMMVPMAAGLTWGNIALDSKEIPDGSYTLRAYTNWMRNFGEASAFKQQFYVSSFNDPLLISANIKKTRQGPKDSIQAALVFNTLDKEPARLLDMQFKVMDGLRTLYRYKGTTTLEGKLNLNFTLADRMKKALIIASRTPKKGEDEIPDLIIPVNANRPENTDLQFMPEGGNLVYGLATRVAFKAIGEDGKGANIEGRILNNKQEEVCTFKSEHKGMGRFDLIPQPGETYTAQVTLPDGVKKNYPLPSIMQTGTILNMSAKGADSLSLTLSITADLLAKGNTSYYLIGQTRGMVYYAAIINFKHQFVRVLLSKALFPTGIARFTLLDANRQPLNERVTYIDQHDQLKLNISPNRNVYTPRDSVALNIQVTNQAGKPVMGAFSIAVTDDNQVKNDTTGSNIISNMLLTAELKGDVEEPAYYLSNGSPQVLADMDNLLLTQGWVGYTWKQVFGPVKKPEFAAEKEFLIQGKVTNIFNKPVAKTGLLLMARKPTMFIDTLTGDDGRFVFRGLMPIDTPSYLIQARNKRGKSFGIGIEVDEFIPPVFSPASFITAPWYVNTDTTALRNLHAVQARQIAWEKTQTKGQVLKDVVIKAKKIVKESKNKNGSGEADMVLDEQDLGKLSNNMTLQQLLELKVKGFKEFGTWDPSPASKPIQTYYVMDRKLIHFIFDGVDVNYSFEGTHAGPTKPDERGRFLRDYLQYYTAGDIKGIEVMSSFKYGATYGNDLLDPMEYQFSHAYIEITTRGGVGPYLKKTPGIAVVKPLPFSFAKQFYRPRYAINSKPNGTDMRATIHWEPNFITDNTGCATVTFYAADKPARYSVIIQGANLNGELGYQRAVLTVK